MGKTYRNGIGKFCNFFLGRNFFVGRLDLLYFRYVRIEIYGHQNGKCQ